MQKKILIVDDSALMRRLAGDIINSDSRFHLEDSAKNGQEALDLLQKKKYDAVILDVNMPRMSGLEMMKQIQRLHIRTRIMMFSSTTGEGTKETLEALELGAVDFIKKPDALAETKSLDFKKEFLRILAVVARCSEEFGSGDNGFAHEAERPRPQLRTGFKNTTADIFRKAKEASRTVSSINASRAALTGSNSAKTEASFNLREAGSKIRGEKLVAIACSTGGPKALNSVVPRLPANLNAPVLLVQHMPAGFTKSLAERLNDLSRIRVKEAEEGELLEKGIVYIAAGGKHMKVGLAGRSSMRVYYTDEPPREGVKPAANYMYESLADAPYAEICCAVLTGMGADGTAGIKNLVKKKNVYVIAQDEATSAVYGMPKAIAKTGLVNEIVPLEGIAEAITKDVGVKGG